LTKGLTNEGKKYYIILELTKERLSCGEIVELLKQTGQIEVAEKLKFFNTSPGLLDIWSMSRDVIIPVERAKIPKGTSLYYEMSKNPRGKCIIINNVPDLVYNQTQRFKHIFEELYFNVITFHCLNAEQIKSQLEIIADDESTVEDDALVVMIITHGEDEKMMGYDACTDNNSEDMMKVSDVVDIFKDFETMPKIFIFECCRFRKSELYESKPKV